MQMCTTNTKDAEQFNQGNIAQFISSGILTIPCGVEMIGDQVFNYNDKATITKIVVPDTVQYIGYQAFAQCTSLASVSLPGSLLHIGDYAFYYCGKLTQVSIPNSVLFIGSQAFSNCENLSRVYLSNQLTMINEGTFLGSGLTSIVIPKTVESIAAQAFGDCESLTCAQVLNENAQIALDAFSIDGSNIHNGTDLKCTNADFGNCQTGQSFSFIYDISIETICTIEANVQFYYQLSQSGLNVSVPDCNNTFQYISILDTPRECLRQCTDFNQCRTNQYTSYPRVESFMKGQIQQFISQSTSTLTIPQNVEFIGSQIYTFVNKSQINSITFQQSVKYIDYHALSDLQISSLELPSQLQYLGPQSITNCQQLTQVQLPSSLTEIQEETFSNCTSLTNIVIPSSIVSIGANAFNNCTSLECAAIMNGECQVDETAFSSTLIENYTQNMGEEAICLGDQYQQCNNETEYIYIINATQNICTKAEFVSYYYIDDQNRRIVVDECPEQYQYQLTSVRPTQCLDNCSEQDIYKYNNKFTIPMQCTIDCDTYYTAGYNCEENCPEDYSYPQSGRVCSQTCLYQIIEEQRRCTSSCQSDQYIYQHELAGECVDQCQQPNYISGIYCATACIGDYAIPTNSQSYVCSDSCRYYIQNEIRYCTDECPDDIQYVVNTERQYCIQSCSQVEGYPYQEKQDGEQHCVSQCSDNHTLNEETNVCEADVNLGVAIGVPIAIVVVILIVIIILFALQCCCFKQKKKVGFHQMVQVA